jgi:magnesium-transporting ATPase (P-type)
MSASRYHFLEGHEVLELLQSNLSSGLTEDEADNRLKTYGLNELPETRSKSIIQRLWAQINSILIYILLIGAALSFGFHHFIDGFVILAVIFINVTLGFIMEGKAESSTKNLQGLMSRSAIVLRSGETKIILAKQLTVGDIFHLQPGDVIPADGRILNSCDLHVFEAALTGESHAILKSPEKLYTEAMDTDIPLAERACIVYSSTQVLKGTALCVVTAVGEQCEIGKIHHLLTSVEETKTPLVIQLERFGAYLSIGILLIAGITLLVAYLRNYSLADGFSIAIGIAVAAIPEGLPSCITITFSIGVYFMSQRKALVKSLPAVETLGSVSVICSDKTGTLTMNKMSVQAISTADNTYKVNVSLFFILLPLTLSSLSTPKQISGNGPEMALENTRIQLLESARQSEADPSLLSLILPGIFCNDTILRITEDSHEESVTANGDMDVESGYTNESYHLEGDPTESCLFELALHQMKPSLLKNWLKAYSRVDVLPFDSSNKFMATLHTVPSSQNEILRHFSSNHLHRGENVSVHIIFMKGAPEKVMEFCRVPCDTEGTRHDQDVQNWGNAAKNLAKQGMRVLGLAYKILPASGSSPINLKDELTAYPHSFVMTSIVGIADPPRPDAIVAIKQAQQAGIIVKMITGDNPFTAVAVGNMLGLQNNRHGKPFSAKTFRPEQHENNVKELLAITGVELDNILSTDHTPNQTLEGVKRHEEVDDRENPQRLLHEKDTTDELFAETVSKYDIFARTTPEHKLLILQSLQRQGFVCSMTGDGVNDAPALKAANIGVAMGITGTEVAKDASKMVLLDDNFACIVDAIRIGRGTYENLIKILCFVLPTNGAQAFSIIAALIIGTEIPITALQILWVNMVTSVTLGLVLAFEPIDEDVMFRQPRKPNKRIFGKFLTWRIIFITVIFVIVILGNFHWEKVSRSINDIHELRTIAVNTLSVLQIGYLFNCRSLRKPRILKLFYGNKVVYFGVFSVAALQALFTYAPFMQFVFSTKSIDAIAWGKIVFWGVVVFLLVEIEKYYSYFYIQKHQRHLNTGCVYLQKWW